MKIATLFPLLVFLFAGCESYVRTLGPTNPTIADAKQGQDCRSQFGLGDVPDLTGAQAIRAGGIAKLRSVEYRVTSFSGIGMDCVIARGE
jgi:hypothetical protein